MVHHLSNLPPEVEASIPREPIRHYSNRNYPRNNERAEIASHKADEDKKPRYKSVELGNIAPSTG